MTTLAEFLTARLDAEYQAWSGGTWLATRADFSKLAAHMLADIVAKRRIVELHSNGHECSQYDHHGEIDACTYSHDFEDCSTLRLLALPFADHPDYQQGWAL